MESMNSDKDIDELPSFRLDGRLAVVTGASDGKFPQADLIVDGSGNLYGTASEGGTVNCDNMTDGCGVVFKVDSSGRQTVLHDFSNIHDGGYPNGIVADAAGNLYGTTNKGGNISEHCKTS